MDVVRIIEDMRDAAYLHRDTLPLNSDLYTIYSHRADALNEAAQKIRAAELTVA